MGMETDTFSHFMLKQMSCVNKMLRDMSLRMLAQFWNILSKYDIFKQ
jgi:hypothetical protein